MTVLWVIWWISAFIIFWAMLGYPLSLILLNKLFGRDNKKDYGYEPSVTVMIVVHNEAGDIAAKLNNTVALDYPADKLEVIIASDYSTDGTDEIVERFIKEHPEIKMRLHRTVGRGGKTVAQNEAQKLCTTELLVMTDANAMLEKNAVRELAAAFSDPSVAYVTGQLKYINTKSNDAAASEGLYWKMDLACRRAESRIQTITAGNGALYAVKNRDYKVVAPIKSHDSQFPVLYALDGRRALYNPEAVAYEKAGEVRSDEYKRKVRMNRAILKGVMPGISIMNVFKYRWFSYFYFGHRTCRYLLWLAHLLVFAVNIPLAVTGNTVMAVLLALQAAVYLAAGIGMWTGCRCRLVRTITYYCMTVVAQWRGVFNMLTGKAAPFWGKAESTRNPMTGGHDER